MDNLLMSVDELSKKLVESGYEYFNFYNGLLGIDFRSGILSHMKSPDSVNFPIYAFSAVIATTPDEPYGIARFSIERDHLDNLYVSSINLSLYENFDGGLRITETLDVKSLQDIPSKKQAGKLLEKAWQKKKMENSAKRKINPASKKGRRNKL